jgi:hypothetical protein
MYVERYMYSYRLKYEISKDNIVDLETEKKNIYNKILKLF